MEFYLQFGYGMMEHTRVLLEEWGGGTVILSPRDLSKDQLLRLSRDIQERHGTVLLDPQFYLPRADHPGLTAHDYWPEEFDTGTFNEGARKTMLADLSALNQQIGAERVILPGRQIDEVDGAWEDELKGTLEDARVLNLENPIPTICASLDVMKSESEIQGMVEVIESLEVDELFFVPERDGYFSQDPNWVSNYLDFVASLSRSGIDVIIGSCSQQQLISAAAGAKAIASGNWVNVRAFTPEKFQAPDPDDIAQRATWFYLPQALSEFKVEYLDIAARVNALEKMRPSPATEFARPLFAGPQPSATGWGETESFRHYLAALRIQAIASSKPSFKETVSSLRALLVGAEETLTALKAKGVEADYRDFSLGSSASKSGLAVLEQTHGPMLEREWEGIQGS